jgi:hypothetical protein
VVRHARAAQIEVPIWVLEYLDHAADKLCALERAAKRGKKFDRGGAMMTALQMKKPGKSGRGDRFKNFKPPADWYWIATDVYEHIRETGDKEIIAIEAVAGSRGLHKSTVHRAWLKAKRAFPEIPRALKSFKKSATF